MVIKVGGTKSFILVIIAMAAIAKGKKTSLRFNPNTGGYEELLVVIGEDMAREECPQILENVKAAITETSRALHQSLDSTVYIDKVNVEVPNTWTEMDCRTPLAPACHPTQGIMAGDVLIGDDHPVHGSFPWTQQSLGCGHPGEFVYLPYSFLEPSNSTQMGQFISNQFNRLRYGVFDDLDPRVSSVPLDSRHHAICRGKSVRDVILSHTDFTSKRSSNNFTIPRFSITKQTPPKYVIVLENSQTMNMRDHWDFIRTSAKKFIVHDLPASVHVGLVLFNDAAHIAHPISLLGTELTSKVRNGLAFSIKNKYNLSPSTGSCVRCGVVKAIEALQTSGSSSGGVIIIISRGMSTSISQGEEKEVLELSLKHSLQIFSMAIPQPPVTDISLSLERLAHNSGGQSFFIVDESFGDKSSLSTYVSLTDAFREVQSRTLRDSPALVMEKQYGPHHEGVYEEHGNFVIDKYSGGHTQFSVFALNPFGNFLKSMNIQDKRGNMFNNIMDNMANYHIFSIYNVPFSSEQNIGMNWSYSLERLPSHHNLNNHMIQVISAPRDVNEKISVRLWTNLPSHAVVVSPSHPVVLYAEVRLGNSPVVEASVMAEIQAINQSGFISPPITLNLLDNGNGDPDLQSQDGIYSRYLTAFPGGEGRYTIRLIVTDNYGKAFSPMKTYPDESRSCCRDKAYAKIANQKLGTFSRIVKGDSFRLSKILPGPLPPARIMNLMVDVHTASQQLEFSWTSPGDDLDSGKPTSYQLFYSDQPGAFFANLNKVEMIESFSAAKSAGGRETHKISVSQFNSNLHYAILAVDGEGNLGEVSNVVKAYMPRPVQPGNDITTSAHSGNELVAGSVVPAEQPNKIILYLIVGIVGFIVLCILVILIILISFRRRKHIPDDEIHPEVGVSTDVNLTNNGFSQDMDSTSRDPESKRFLLGNSGNSDSAGPGPIHSSMRDESGSVSSNPYGYLPAQHNNSYGWAATSNPYVYKDNNETYASIASFHNTSQDSYIRNTSQDSYIRGFNPTYAQPIPKSLRPHHIYSNAAVIARHSPQSSISHQTSAEISRGTVTFQSSTSTPPLRVSPDSQCSEQSQQSNPAATPTKSILKKPKGPDLTTSLDITDRESQSSQASAASCSSSQKLDDGGARSPSATDTVSSQQSAMSTVTMDDINLSIEKTYLETSFEFSPLPVGCQLGHKPSPTDTPILSYPTDTPILSYPDTPILPPSLPKQPPPTLPKPKLGCIGSQDLQDALNGDSNLSSLDKKIRNCTQV